MINLRKINFLILLIQTLSRFFLAIKCVLLVLSKNISNKVEKNCIIVESIDSERNKKAINNFLTFFEVKHSIF